jgi:hypothetical protein
MVKAFSFRVHGDRDKAIEAIQNTVAETMDRLRMEAMRGSQAGDEISGNISFHPQTAVLVATGTKTYVEVAAAIIEAYKDAAMVIGPRTGKTE